MVFEYIEVFYNRISVMQRLATLHRLITLLSSTPVGSKLLHNLDDLPAHEIGYRSMMLNRITNRVLRSFNPDAPASQCANVPEQSSMTPAKLRPRAPNLLLLGELLRTPKAIGAVCSSSQRLANRMAAWIDVRQEGWVIELGGGTGAITAALLRHGVAADKLIVIEKSARLASHLSNRFPGIRVVHSDAADIAVMLKRGMPVKAVVSGLPLRSLPMDAVNNITNACAQTLSEKGCVIQFTYAPFGTSPWLAAGLKKTASETVWANIPPAWVEIFTYP